MLEGTIHRIWPLRSRHTPDEGQDHKNGRCLSRASARSDMQMLVLTILYHGSAYFSNGCAEELPNEAALSAQSAARLRRIGGNKYLYRFRYIIRLDAFSLFRISNLISNR